jgi:hypothetical protein
VLDLSNLFRGIELLGRKAVVLRVRRAELIRGRDWIDPDARGARVAVVVDPTCRIICGLSRGDCPAFPFSARREGEQDEQQDCDSSH